VISVLIGSKSDEPILQESGLLALLKNFGLDYECTVISSDRNPERLRNYCLKNKKRVQLIIAIAGGVPNLPIVAKSWLPDIPVICVPIDNNSDYALAAITTPRDLPIIIVGYGKTGLQKAAYTAKQILSI